MRLHDYWRSSAAYRVRIALNLKGLQYQSHPVALAEGEQREAGHLDLNPQGLVPVLEHAGHTLTQSTAIIEYLEEIQPVPPLLPADAAGRARVRALAQAVACDIHPLNNLRVLRYLSATLDVDGAAKLAWYRHWVGLGFGALETALGRDGETGEFCHGDDPTMADVYLVPQVYNALRFDCDLSAYPTLRRINAACLALPAFDAAVPEAQPGAA